MLDACGWMLDGFRLECEMDLSGHNLMWGEALVVQGDVAIGVG